MGYGFRRCPDDAAGLSASAHHLLRCLSWILCPRHGSYFLGFDVLAGGFDLKEAGKGQAGPRQRGAIAPMLQIILIEILLWFVLWLSEREEVTHHSVNSRPLASPRATASWCRGWLGGTPGNSWYASIAALLFWMVLLWTIFQH